MRRNVHRLMGAAHITARTTTVTTYIHTQTCTLLTQIKENYQKWVNRFQNHVTDQWQKVKNW